MSFTTRRPNAPAMNRHRRSIDFGHSAGPSRVFKIMMGISISFIIITALIVGTAVLSGGFWKTATATDCTVTEKSVAVVDGYSEYRIHTENCDVFVLSDSILDGKFSSATAYSKIKEGETYDFDTRGQRVPFFSMFPNIISFTQTS